MSISSFAGNKISFETDEFSVAPYAEDELSNVAISSRNLGNSLMAIAQMMLLEPSHP